MAAPRRVCAVVPTYNERESVARLVQEVRRSGPPAMFILFVDDSSPDGTGDLVRELASKDPGIRLLSRASKMGIGSAYQDGFRDALASLSPDVVVEMDADLQHPPAAIARLVRGVEEGADVAVGSRYVKGGGVAGWGLRRRAVSRAANAYAKAVLRIGVRDATSGFRAYSRGAAERVASARLPAKGFEFQVASLHLLRGWRLAEVPYIFSARSAGKSKLGIRDMARFLLSVPRLAFS
jgi:dolichol-phosphate mannosyltransferase